MEPPFAFEVDLGVGLVILGVSLLIVAFFSSAEASLISVNKFRIRHLAEQGSSRAQAVLRVVSKHEKFFATILLTENAFIILASSVGTALAIGFFGGSALTVVLSSLVMTLVIVSLAEITPKSLAAQAAERWSLLVARVIEVVMALETWIVYLFTLLPRALLKLAGGKEVVQTPSITEGELRMLIEMGRAEGQVKPHEAEVMHSVLQFSDKPVKEIMTSRTEVAWIEDGTTLEQFMKIYFENAHSRFPVFAGRRDNIIGILSTKDIFRAMGQEELKPSDSVTRSIRPAYFVPDSKPAGEVFNELRSQQGQRMAIVVDEYGGVAGVVTLIQLVEEVVGPVGGEGEEDDDYSQLAINVFQVDAGMRVDELKERLGVKLPDGDYETLAGLILKTLGHLPKEGERVLLPGVEMVVTGVSGVKVHSARITLLGKQPQQEHA